MKTAFASCILAVGLGWVFLSSAPAFARPVLDPQFQTKGISLDRLEKDVGARFGDWTVWRLESGGDSISLVHRGSGQAIYMPWNSNGWINHRTARGNWCVLFSAGPSQPQDRSDLGIETFFGKQPPRILASGKHTFAGWNVLVTRDAIDFHLTQMDGVVKDRMTIRPWSASFTHNGRTIDP
jgi:hypothetical protein